MKEGVTLKMSRRLVSPQLMLMGGGMWVFVCWLQLGASVWLEGVSLMKLKFKVVNLGKPIG